MATPDYLYADLALVNGKVVTIDDRDTMAEALAIKDRRARWMRIGKGAVYLLIIGILLGWGTVVYYRYRWLRNDEAVMDCIAESDQVSYSLVELEDVEFFTKAKDGLLEGEEMTGPTLFLRWFTAYKYPRGQVAPESNYCFDGYVDMNRRVHIVRGRPVSEVYI